MPDPEREAYVRSALALLGYPTDEAFVARILPQFALIASIASNIVDSELPLDLEPAPVFRP